jgi:hypothetical protein
MLKRYAAAWMFLCVGMVGLAGAGPKAMVVRSQDSVMGSDMPPCSGNELMNPKPDCQIVAGAGCAAGKFDMVRKELSTTTITKIWDRAPGPGQCGGINSGAECDKYNLVEHAPKKPLDTVCTPRPGTEPIE